MTRALGTGRASRYIGDRAAAGKLLLTVLGKLRKERAGVFILVPVRPPSVRVRPATTSLGCSRFGFGDRVWRAKLRPRVADLFLKRSAELSKTFRGFWFIDSVLHRDS